MCVAAVTPEVPEPDWTTVLVARNVKNSSSDVDAVDAATATSVPAASEEARGESSAPAKSTQHAISAHHREAYTLLPAAHLRKAGGDTRKQTKLMLARIVEPAVSRCRMQAGVLMLGCRNGVDVFLVSNACA